MLTLCMTLLTVRDFTILVDEIDMAVDIDVHTIQLASPKTNTKTSTPKLSSLDVLYAI